MLLRGPAHLGNAATGKVAVLKVDGCERADDPLYQWSEESCSQVEGRGVGNNTQAVRTQV